MTVRRLLVVSVLVLAACSGDDDVAAPPTEAEAATVRVVSINLLHGIACPADSDGCDLPARVALFARQLDEGGCPEVVGVQEANERTVSLLRDALPDTCDGAYEIVWDGDLSSCLAYSVPGWHFWGWGSPIHCGCC